MGSALSVFVVAALLCAGASLWLLGAYRRADEAAKPGPALLVCVVVSAAALAGYVLIGRPELADAAYSERLDALKQRDPTSYSADEALAILAEAAREEPRDPRPHLYSGQVLLDSGRAEEAARAFDAALRRDPDMTEAMLGLARSMVQIDGGRVSDDARSLFEQVAATSNDPAPWIYQAMSAMQSGDEAGARRFWGEALTRMAPDDPRREMAGRMSRGEAVDGEN
ncbi:cytochrome c heme lyase subunit CcmH [alpha proteobacterium U9-1i]|nr:cytochrome c heme lyase subunit CcmH [alpha proteobacterium U9-1i]